MGLFKDCGCGCDGQKQQEKFTISIISALTFFIIANPETFRLVRHIFGPRIATPNGCPSTMGLIVHSLVFLLVVWGMMNVRKEEKALFPGPSASAPVSGCGCGDTKGTKVVLTQAPPVPMVDAPLPEPDFQEQQFQFMDSGLELDALDINSI